MSASEVYVDVSFISGSVVHPRREQLRVDSEGLTWRNERVDFHPVTALSYYGYKTAPAGVSTLSFVIDLYVGKKRTEVAFGGVVGKRTPYQRGVFEDTVQVLRRHVEPRLISGVLERIDRGETVVVAGFTFSQEGLKRRRFAPWSTNLELKTISSSPTDELKITAIDSRGRKRKIGVGLWHIPNCVLVPRLVSACTARYSGA